MAASGSKNEIFATDSARRFGFKFGSNGTHTSRTIMLAELAQVLAAVPPSGTRDDYVAAIIDGNVTEKKTVATRRYTSQRLSELYGLAPSLVLFRVLRRFWDADANGRPLLAILCALARDPLLRATATVVLAAKPGEELSRQELSEAVQAAAGSRLNESTADKVVRNTSSSWAQSGHLRGRVRKIRQRINPTPLAVTYALLLGYLEGVRGGHLFRTIWARTLDVVPDEMIFLAKDAKRFGVLDLKHAGDVLEIGFSSLLTRDEIRDSHGTN